MRRAFGRTANGHVHFSVPEILQHLGIADVPEERAENMAIIAAILNTNPDGVSVMVRHARPSMPPTL